MGQLDGKVAFVTGAARGQGRASALKLASEGADIVALDICNPTALATLSYDLSSEADLAATVSDIEALDRRVVHGIADIRHLSEVQRVVDAGLEAFGHVDLVHANAGIGSWGVTWELSELDWREMIDVNLTGQFNTIRAVLPSMVARGAGGSIVLTSSTAGLISYPNTAHYTAAKHGVIGLMGTLSQELGPHNIRINCICPTTVNTALVINDATFALFAPEVEQPGPADVRDAFTGLNSLPVPWIEVEDVAEAVLWLLSDQARYVHGASIPIDAGNVAKKGT